MKAKLHILNKANAKLEQAALWIESYELTPTNLQMQPYLCMISSTINVQYHLSSYD